MIKFYTSSNTVVADSVTAKKIVNWCNNNLDTEDWYISPSNYEDTEIISLVNNDDFYYLLKNFEFGEVLDYI